MKKHRTARLLSVILAVVMIFGSISVGVTAAYAPYLDDALTDNYNTIDQVTLTEAQQASLLLDKVDRALADANIVIDVSVVGTLNLTSIDNALSSIYSVTGNILFSSATVGDLTVVLFGDLNGDGEITDADQTIMNSLVSGGDTAGFFAGGPFFTAADLNSDGQIDATDKAIMDAHIAGTYVIDQTGNNELPAA